MYNVSLIFTDSPGSLSPFSLQKLSVLCALKQKKRLFLILFQLNTVPLWLTSLPPSLPPYWRLGTAPRNGMASFDKEDCLLLLYFLSLERLSAGLSCQNQEWQQVQVAKEENHRSMSSLLKAPRWVYATDTALQYSTPIHLLNLDFPLQDS